MKTHKTQNTLKLPAEIDEAEEIEVIVYYQIANDGIGHYEYWGAKCYDKGTDYVDIDDIQPIFSPEHSDSDRRRITDYIEANFIECANTLTEKMTPEPPDEKDTDY